MDLGVNLCFAIKRWPEPERWAAIVADDLGLASVQFTMDLIDPWWPAGVRAAAAGRARAAAARRGLAIHSVQIGLAGYTYNGLLHPDADVRALGRDWWRRSIDLAAELGVGAAGGPLGALSAADAASPARRAALRDGLLADVHALAEHARAAGLDALLVEPTPLPRELVSTVAETQALLRDCAETAVPLRLVLDVGHMLYRPLYGDAVALGDWLRPLAEHVGALHLQNHDYASDAHWGWPEPRGRFAPRDLLNAAADAGLAATPVFLEVFVPFEQDDASVLALLRTSVAACRPG
jgi:sugar phosphate isomerase/epimerase